MYLHLHLHLYLNIYFYFHLDLQVYGYKMDEDEDEEDDPVGYRLRTPPPIMVFLDLGTFTNPFGAAAGTAPPFFPPFIVEVRFFSSFAFRVRSFTSLRAASRWAFRTSGF